MIYIYLFFEFLKIGIVSFGGGFSTLPYIFELPNKFHTLTNEGISNILTVSQVTPGPFACNIGTIVGLKEAGIIGAFLCNLGFVLPAIIFMGIGYKFTQKIKKNKDLEEVIRVVRSCAIAIMISSSVYLFKCAFCVDNKLNYKAIFLGIIICYILNKKKANSLFWMVSAVFLGTIFKI